MAARTPVRLGRDLALLHAESLEGLQLAGYHRRGLSCAESHERADSGTRQRKDDLAIHSELHSCLGRFGANLDPQPMRPPQTRPAFDP